MKAKELMVGDWIQALCENYEPYEVVLEKSQITHINRETIYVANGNIFYGEDGEIRRYSIAEPIKLTEEILQKNGWTAVPEYSIPFEDCQQDIVGYHWSPNFNTYPLNLLQLTDDSGMFKVFNGVTIYYVHELQHALRLCGLNELEDNFKVE